jgi:hypothetical protein
VALNARTYKYREGKIGEYRTMIEDPIHAFEGFGKAFKDEFWVPWTKLDAEGSRAGRSLIKGMREHVKEFTPFERLQMTIAGLARNKGGKQALKADGIIDIPILNARLEAGLKYLVDTYASLHDQINYVRAKTGEAPLGKLDNYLLFVHRMSELNKAGIVQSLTGVSRKKLGTALREFSGTNFPFDKQRKITNLPLELDIFNTFEKYVNGAMKEIYVAPIAAKAKEVSVAKFDMNGKKNKVSLLDKNPEAARFLNQWADDILGIDPLAAAMNKKHPKFMRRMHALSKNIVIAMIGGAPGTVLKQPTALVGTWAMTSTKDTIYGVIRALGDNPFDKYNSRAAKEGDVIEMRSMDIAFDQISKDIALGKMGKGKEYLTKASLAPLTIMDHVIATSTWYAGERFAKRVKKLGDEDARQYANDTVVKTQALGIKGGVAPVQSTGLLKPFTLLQTFAIANFNLIARDILGIKNPDITKWEQVKRVVKFTTGVALVNSAFQIAGLEPPFPAPINAYLKSKEDNDSRLKTLGNVATEALEIFPLGGSSIKYDSNLGGPLGQLLGEVPEAVKLINQSVDWNTLSNSEQNVILFKVGKTLGQLYGIPMTMTIAKAASARVNGGNWYEALLGVYVEKKGKGNGPPTLDGNSLGDGPGSLGF